VNTAEMAAAAQGPMLLVAMDPPMGYPLTTADFHPQFVASFRIMAPGVPAAAAVDTAATVVESRRS